jgi:hypothetical protein
MPLIRQISEEILDFKFVSAVPRTIPLHRKPVGAPALCEAKAAAIADGRLC